MGGNAIKWHSQTKAHQNIGIREISNFESFKQEQYTTAREKTNCSWPNPQLCRTKPGRRIRKHRLRGLITAWPWAVSSSVKMKDNINNTRLAHSTGSMWKANTTGHREYTEATVNHKLLFYVFLSCSYNGLKITRDETNAHQSGFFFCNINGTHFLRSLASFITTVFPEVIRSQNSPEESLTQSIFLHNLNQAWPVTSSQHCSY